MVEKIEFPLQRCPPVLTNDSSSHHYMTYLRGIIENPRTRKKDLTLKRFLLDTGASISILNRTCQKLFEDTETVGETQIQYGSGRVRKLPVYQVILKIKGVKFRINAALDSNLNSPSLLGHYAFLNNLNHIQISRKRRRLTIVK